MLPFLPNVSRPSSLDAKLGGRRTEGLAVAGLEMVGLTALLRQHRGVSGDGGTEVARAVAWAVATKAGARVAGAMATGVVRTSQNEAARRKRHFGTRGWTSEERCGYQCVQVPKLCPSWLNQRTTPNREVSQ